MNGLRLKTILDSVRAQEDLQPAYNLAGEVIVTYCNIGIDRILGLYGALRMTNRLSGQPHLANDMIDCMENNPALYLKVSGEEAAAMAIIGGLIIAGQKDDSGHGHVAAVYPGPTDYSGSWAKDVPVLNNIGKTVGVLRASQCFKTEPTYYALIVKGA